MRGVKIEVLTCNERINLADPTRGKCPKSQYR